MKTKLKYVNHENRNLTTIICGFPHLKRVIILNKTKRIGFNFYPLSKFDWKNSVLTSDEISELENVLIEFEDIFVKHRFDVGCNTEMKIKLTPENSNAVYMQNPPTPLHLRDEMMVELALLQYYGIITILTNSKYSNPTFAQRKPSGKLRVLHDLRTINYLLRHDYANHNCPTSNMTDAVSHFAGKKLFTKLDCSRAYHCVQMADPLSV